MFKGSGFRVEKTEPEPGNEYTLLETFAKPDNTCHLMKDDGLF